jgi:aspartate racemase
MKIKSDGIKKVGLLGAKYTMKESFYVDRLKTHNIETIIPNDSDCDIVHDMIYNELCQGKFTDASRKKLESIIENLCNDGAEGVILGCTELPILLPPSENKLRLYDSMFLHAAAASNFAFLPTRITSLMSA